MAKKKIGIYGILESTANNKVDDLYLIVDEQSIAFSVKNIVSNEYRSFEYFVNDPENQGWNQLIAYLQNNSKLIQSIYHQIHFVINSPRFILTKSNVLDHPISYKNELYLVQGERVDEEIFTTHLADGQLVAFGVPDVLNTLLMRSFPTGRWHHYVEYLIHNTMQDGIGVYMFDLNYCIVIKEEEKLKLLNYFKVGGDDQNTYTLLNACSNASIAPHTKSLTVAGFEIAQLNWIDTLKQYFANTTILMAPDGGIGHSLNKDYPNHTYSPYFIF